MEVITVWWVVPSWDVDRSWGYGCTLVKREFVYGMETGTLRYDGVGPFGLVESCRPAISLMARLAMAAFSLWTCFERIFTV